ncbi:addiction module protein [Limnochorda pilosa]|uniref:addiction module protein n=1 Tax=Limnochorda pilosa TaxID=1555112 RepID=UPI0009EABAF9
MHFGSTRRPRLRSPLNSWQAWTAPPDPDAEAAWAAEIQRRVAALEAGTTQLEPWGDVKRRIEREILDR